MSLLTVGLLYFTQVSVDGSYLGDLLPGFLIISMGMAFSFVSISIAALAGVQAKDAGLASGLINTSQQIGGALGIAVLSSVAIAQSNDATEAGDAVPQALTSGFQAAFWVGAGVAAAGVLASLFLIRKEELASVPERRGSAGRRLDRLDTTRVGPGSVRGLRVSGVVRRALDGEDHPDGGDWAPAARALCGCHSDRARRHGRRHAGDRRAARPHRRDQGARGAVRDERRVPRPLSARVANRRQPLERAVRDRDLRRRRVRRRAAVHRHGIPPGRHARRPAPRRAGRPGTGARLARTGRRRHSTPPTPEGSSTGT